ncbi:MAG TPA: hypothetical protein VFJ85_01355 [Acidimicrobiales bacterium]|nr:hypothetical protein [Acidimicrobiales bacterium]
MATFDAALVKEQGVTFAVVAVRPGVLEQPTRREQARARFSMGFGGVPVVLMEQDGSGRPRYSGRHDLVDFLANVFIEQLPWGKYQLN